MVLRRAVLAGAVAVTAAAIGAAATWRWANPPRSQLISPPVAAMVGAGSEDEDPPEAEDVATVKTVHPKRDKAFTVTVHQFATVEAYYTADLRARASGVVKYVPKDVGGRVTQGELLVEIDVPDLRQEVAQKEAV